MSQADKTTLYTWLVRRGIDTRSARDLVDIAASYGVPVSIHVQA